VASIHAHVVRSLNALRSCSGASSYWLIEIDACLLATVVAWSPEGPQQRPAASLAGSTAGVSGAGWSML
jgi:hypothetical protein